MNDMVDSYEWAYTRQLILKASGRFKDIPIDKLMLAFGKKGEDQEEISKNLGLIKAMLTKPNKEKKNGIRQHNRKTPVG